MISFFRPDIKERYSAGIHCLPSHGSHQRSLVCPETRERLPIGPHDFVGFFAAVVLHTNLELNFLAFVEMAIPFGVADHDLALVNKNIIATCVGLEKAETFYEERVTLDLICVLWRSRFHL